jgi:alanine dehydrogenase
MTRILTPHDIAPLISLDDCIAAVENVFRRYGEGDISKSQTLGFRVGEGTFHVKAAADDVFVTKINANFPANPSRHGLPTVQGVVVVMDVERGTIAGMLDSGFVTTMRTAAATAVAAKYLSLPDARVAAIIGCGVQGQASLDALRRVRKIEKAHVFDADPARTLVGDIDIIRARTLDEALDGADIVVTCTPSKTPFLDERHARSGRFIAAVGADNPEKSEIAPALMAKARVVPDVLDQTATMGDLHHAIEAGLMSRDDIHAELGAIVAGRASGRQSRDELFIFDSTGTAIQDVVVASLVLRRALTSV